MNYYVYGDFTDDGRPFYFGKGDERRIRGLSRNDVHFRIRNRYGQNREVLLVTSVEQIALDNEVELIALHNTFVGKDHPLNAWGANLTRGGEGTAGHIVSEQSRLKMSISHRGKKHSAEHVTRCAEGHRGKRCSDETRAKISRARLGQLPSVATRQRMSVSQRGRKISAEHRQKLREAYQRNATRKAS